MARAFGSYPECQRFESTRRYHEKTVQVERFALFFFVSRTGVIKPPVQLGVGKKSLEKKASYAILKVVWQPQKVSKEASS